MRSRDSWKAVLLGFEANPLKFAGGDQAFLSLLNEFGFQVEAPTSWCERGFFISAGTSSKLGSHPLTGAGLLYLQEPGAMEAVEWLDPQPGELILDLCAAPGGKSTQIAEKLGGKGWLVANDPVQARAERLEALLARHGALNSSVYSLDPTSMAENFSACFDRVLVDAPCSGESLFAKRFRSYVGTFRRRHEDALFAANGFSMPPLKKYVTWAYFSVSAQRRFFKFCSAKTCARMCAIFSGAIT